ncbi:hypothetical protein B0H14DRAFT_3437819 [Mycena olivaceomarginata]|nr:hypothetical protein B0H14DRAFT_3437819 [Mycena olivaceomarginata]
MATGGGKSALFAVPIIVLKELALHSGLYPDLSMGARARGRAAWRVGGASYEDEHYDYDDEKEEDSEPGRMTSFQPMGEAIID